MPARRQCTIPLLFVGILAVLFTLPAAASSEIDTLFRLSQASSPPEILDHPYVAGEVLVRFHEPISFEQARQTAQGAGASSLHRRYAKGLYLARTAANPTATEALVRALQRSPKVWIAEPNYIGRGGGAPNDPVYTQQWHLEQDTDVDLDAEAAWAMPQGLNEVVIAVLDSGTDFDHPDLRFRLKTNPKEIPNNNLDDDGNGLIDDATGWDFSESDKDPMADRDLHGVVVTGTAMARSNNGFQVSGVSSTAKYVPIRVIDSSGVGDLEWLIDGLYYAANLGYVDIINLSLVRFPQSSLLDLALNEAARNTRIIACAGNEGPGKADLYYPGSHFSVLSVNATDRWDQLYSGASTGYSVDLSAPGVNIVTVSPEKTYLPGDFSIWTGCSFSTPLVAGVSAMMMAHWKGLDRERLETFLADSAVDLGAPGIDNEYGWGRVNAADALQAMFSELVFADSFETGGTYAWSSETP